MDCSLRPAGRAATLSPAAAPAWATLNLSLIHISPDIENNPVLRFMRRVMRITPKTEGEAFFVRKPDPATGKLALWATPLFVALVLVEIVDLIFAVDSVPAIFAITTDPYIIYTSNIFAILGLRALYFALAAVIDRFKYLKQALALVLVFIGSIIGPLVADYLSGFLALVRP